MDLLKQNAINKVGLFLNQKSNYEYHLNLI